MSGTTIESGLSADTGLLSTIAHPKSPNLMELYSGAAQAANQQWQNRLMQSKEASGQAFLQRGINPDGTVSATNLNLGLQANPNTALTAMESSKGGQELDTAGWAQKMRRLSTGAAGALTVLADNNGTAPREHMNAYYDRLVDQGVITAAERDEAEREFTDDPVKNAMIVRQRAVQNLAMQQALEATRPGIGQADLGGGLQGFTTGPKMGPTPGVMTPVGPTMPKGLTPGEQETRVPAVDDRLYLPDGSPNPQFGQPYTVPLKDVRGGGPGSSGAPSPANQPRLPTPGAGGGGTGGGATTAQPPPQQTAGGQGGRLPTGLAPGATQPIEAANADWAKASSATSTYAQRSFPLNQAIALAQSGDLKTGPGAETVNNVKAYLQTRLATLGIDAQTLETSKMQELTKYLQQTVNTSPLAGQSDARLASAISGNPSAHMNNLALVDTLKAAQAIMRMEQLAAIDFAARGAPNGQWHNFMRAWGTEHDPRAFLSLKDDEYRTMFGKMTAPERIAFAKTRTLINEHPEIMSSTAVPH